MGTLRVVALSFVTATLLCLSSIAQQPTPLPAPKTAEVFGEKISYYEAGEGPAVILLHGTGGSGENWMRNFGPLSKSFHVYAPDQIGFGHSDKPLMDFKIETFVDFLAEFMRVAGMPRAEIVGHSTGGWIAARFAIQHPEMVDKLVLVDSTGLPLDSSANPPKPVDFSYASLTATRAILERFFYHKQLVTDELVRRTFQNHIRTGDSYTIQRLLANRASEYLGDNLKSIQAPTLIVWGREDSILPVSQADRFHAAIPDSQVVIIEACGHVTPIEKSAEFDEALIKFLRR